MNNKIETVHKKLIVSMPRHCRKNHYILPLLWDGWHWPQKKVEQQEYDANTKEDIAEIRKNVDLPIIGIVKRDYPDCKSVHYTNG